MAKSRAASACFFSSSRKPFSIIFDLASADFAAALAASFSSSSGPVNAFCCSDST
jgi:hypothetical protein